ncbi:MAG: DUF2190 family protein [Erythrobacter sp.]|nr:DUF2190 family protein [Erythrobacter sp.]
MRSYDTPGRIITVSNTGPGAVAVRADQPYRLRNLIGVTVQPAKVGEDFNLCVEGVCGLMVELADPATPAIEGDPVSMSTDGSWKLVANAPAEGFVSFGILTQPIKRPTEVALVKIAPAASSGGAEAPGYDDTALAGRVSEAETAIGTLSGRTDAAEADIAALQAGDGGSANDAVVMNASHTVGFPTSGSTVVLPMTQVVQAQGRDCHMEQSGPGANKYFVAEADGTFQFNVTLLARVGYPNGIPKGRLYMKLFKYDSAGSFVGAAGFGLSPDYDAAGWAGFEGPPNGGYMDGSGPAIIRMIAGQRAAIVVASLGDKSVKNGPTSDGLLIDECLVSMRRIA